MKKLLIVGFIFSLLSSGAANAAKPSDQAFYLTCNVPSVAAWNVPKNTGYVQYVVNGTVSGVGYKKTQFALNAGLQPGDVVVGYSIANNGKPTGGFAVVLCY